MYFDKERLIRELVDNTNSMVEAITLENFEDMSEDDLRSLILIGSGRVRHAYRPESLYSQYVARRGRHLTDPLDPSYELTQEDLEKVFNEMRKKFDGFEPQVFTTVYEDDNTTIKQLILDEEPLRVNMRLRCEDGRPHSLLSQRNTYIDNLERDFNDMVNRQYVNEKRPLEYDKGKGPGGFPMGGGNGNYGMPAKEPFFEDHLIWLHDPDRAYSNKDTLAYKYKIIPKNTYLFSPGNTTPGQIHSQKMPDWMTTDPSRRDKVSFTEKIIKEKTKQKEPITEGYYYYKEPNIEHYYEEPPKKENRKIWLFVAFILFIFLLRKRR
uniref:Uncharacterized protein n=1 Tax=viral metagenome TaxID=1070528 RepID=A0A6C0DK67_9ZZZZ